MMKFTPRIPIVLFLDELEHPGYRALEPVSRALLTELRALDSPFAGRLVTLSIREARRRLNVTQRPVERAFKQLLEHGWIEEAKGAGGQRRYFLLKSPIAVAHG
ncbi:MAG: hypothetical protein GAK34_00634 [Delftia tsuruhatensis]|nr:MAG: hypothetical protein GAK34_00634 [Delftia tsuruhatensis]